MSPTLYPPPVMFAVGADECICTYACNQETTYNRDNNYRKRLILPNYYKEELQIFVSVTLKNAIQCSGYTQTAP